MKGLKCIGEAADCDDVLVQMSRTLWLLLEDKLPSIARQLRARADQIDRMLEEPAAARVEDCAGDAGAVGFREILEPEMAARLEHQRAAVEAGERGRPLADVVQGEEPAEETGWLTETVEGAPRWWAGGSHLTDDSLRAIRFARKVDAEAIAGQVGPVLGERLVASEHAWLGRNVIALDREPR